MTSMFKYVGHIYMPKLVADMLSALTVVRIYYKYDVRMHKGRKINA
jgi:hypothetical protein